MNPISPLLTLTTATSPEVILCHTTLANCPVTCDDDDPPPLEEVLEEVLLAAAAAAAEHYN